MKKIISIMLCVAMLFSLVACNNDKKAFSASKEAYDNVSAAYEITEKYGNDIYETWRIAIYEKEELIENGVSYLTDDISLSENGLIDGFAATIAEALSMNWDTISDEEKNTCREIADDSLEIMKDNLFSFCIQSVNAAYKLNGSADKATSALESAKTQMKDLSTEFSDYEHYPNLKGYYTTTKSFFEFCQNPTGSFEQVKETINNYRNEARDYISDLDYIFE